MDCVVENYVFIVERLGEQIEDIEAEVLERAEPAVMEKIHAFKHEMNFIRKSVRPAREAVIQLSKLDSELINVQTIPFLKDRRTKLPMLPKPSIHTGTCFQIN